MPDIPFFDAAGFFAQKIVEVERTLIAKKAELEILYANRMNLESTINSLALLSPEHRKAIQAELANLKEVLASTERSISGLESEIEVLSSKLAALHAARELVSVDDQQ